MLQLHIEELCIEIHVNKLRQCVSIGTQPENTENRQSAELKKVPRFAQLI
jgi:hypothetical protein